MTEPAVDIESRLASIIPNLRSALRDDASRPRKGRVRRATGTVIHATMEEARIGEICELVDPRTGKTTKAEVVGLVDDMAILVPLGDLTGLSSLTEVVATGKDQRVPVGPGLLGRVISAFGEPLDGKPLSPGGITGSYPVNAYPPSPLERSLISDPIQLGIRALDGLLTCARGQRVGIFGEPGVGKSILLSDIVSGTDADVAVVALVGERGREVREFLEQQLGPEGRQRAIVVVATSDRPAIERVKAAYVATSIAEYFRDQGKHVLLAMDNITRFARAQREIGLASGEPPTRRGFPSSLFAVLPRLLERSGPGRVGSITSLYSVLLEGDGTLDPVAEEIQALLDGHVFLSNELAQRNHFPAIDVLRSRSRLMDAVVQPAHRSDASHLRALLARYADIELLLRVGEYEKGSDALADEAVAKIDAINAFLRQGSATHESIEKTRQRMREIVNERS
ncbi:FliI/YscN family ATPase [Mesorhizobium sp. WSM4303]|uniref:FliI/YscN family ATPase n=1 Tax=unclassified Mesorhizobium TaxID=325217 RepID=UPI00115C4B68|nr:MULTISPECIES: FliI/YscN family ATPase [unclassified Mesorhizobium]TRC93085.1 FliI/YscN family ATPase [Mesorhizobium sp. WSM4306]TRD02342.1 FliI/YscN family ATPase [Mesorhizobium sp. WSM4303]